MKTHILPKLPFATDALEPFISKETVDFHYNKHHQGYVDKLNRLLPSTPWENSSLEEIVRDTFKKEPRIFNQAAQVWNHTFYWNSLTSPQEGAGNIPSRNLAEAIDRDFGSLQTFKDTFTMAALDLFGSGWTWLVADANGKLSILPTRNADNPLSFGLKPLLTCDIWEHAYYIDYRNARPQYLKNVWQLFNWEFAARNYVQTAYQKAA
jgi:Fe-Mn family superoxide dismutase